jgi:GT2 family glycosyltransferase
MQAVATSPGESDQLPAASAGSALQPSGGPEALASSRVAVLMPAYNPGDIIHRALESIARSTYPCDVYIVDDASNPPVAETVGRLPGVQVIRLEQNGGPAIARNVGLATILSKNYNFVALLDSDDIAHPERIATQVAFLDDHPEFGAVGAWARVTGENGEALYIARTPDDPAEFRKTLYYNAAIVNSTLMIRTDVLRAVGLYSKRYPVAEDYELLRRIAKKYAVTNIPSVLIDYRRSTGGVSLRRRRRQLFDRFRIQLKYFTPWDANAWMGLGKTLLLFFVPVSLIARMKAYGDRGVTAVEAQPDSPGPRDS